MTSQPYQVTRRSEGAKPFPVLPTSRQLRSAMRRHWLWAVVLALLVLARFAHRTLINDWNGEDPYIAEGVAPLTEEVIKFGTGALFGFLALFIVYVYHRGRVKGRWYGDHRYYVAAGVAAFALYVGIGEGFTPRTHTFYPDVAMEHAIAQLAFSFIPVAVYVLYQRGLWTLSALGHAILFHSMANAFIDSVGADIMFDIICVILIIEVAVTLFVIRKRRAIARRKGPVGDLVPFDVQPLDE